MDELAEECGAAGYVSEKKAGVVWHEVEARAMKPKKEEILHE
jgi:hypothetical protein